MQNSGAPPNERSLCRSAAHSNLCLLASETHNTQNGADPIFDAWCLVLTNQSKSRGELLQPQIKTSKMASLNKDNILKLFNSKPFFFYTRSTTTPNGHLHQKTYRMKSFWWFALVSWDFAIYGTAGHSELLRVSCYCASAYVGSIHLSLCLHWHLAQTLATVFWFTASVRWA